MNLRNNQLSDNMKSQLNAIKQYKKDGSNGYQQVKEMKKVDTQHKINIYIYILPTTIYPYNLRNYNILNISYYPKIMNIPSVIKLVTGAASGLGRATAQRLLKNGAKVVVVDLPNALEGEGLEALKANTPEYNDDNVMFAASCDVTSEDDQKMHLEG